jgi:hypothetical protein
MATAAICSGNGTNFLSRYKGTPYGDSRIMAAPQQIPGVVYFAYYDRGGEGVAYHDSDALNNGSNSTLNPANRSYLSEFRRHEGVDVSYTMMGREPKIDDSPYNKVTPPADLLYVGWTVPGEWFNLTVQAAETGNYAGDLLFTSNRGGTIAIDVNGEPATGALALPSTANAADPIVWRQWHHWSVAQRLVRLHLNAGRNVLTVHIVSEGQMNLAFLAFRSAA